MRHFYRTAAVAVFSFILGSTLTPFVSHAQMPTPAVPVVNSLVSPALIADAGPAQDAATVQVPEIATPDTKDAEPKPTSLAALIALHHDAVEPDAESKCLAAAIYFEAKGEPIMGQLAVAQVMLNRMRSGRFPETLCGVVMQSRQFSFVHHGVIPNIPLDDRAWHTAVAIAEIARAELWESGVKDAMFFHARRVSPHWRLTQVAALGNHIFYH